MLIKDFKIEYRVNPIGIDAAAPRFSWKLETDIQDTVQKSYHLAVNNGDTVVWDTGVVESDKSICVVYAGEELQPMTRYQVELTVTTNHGERASAEAVFETGLMAYENFKADWITHGFADDLEACAVFAKDFSCKGDVKKARLYASALGIYEFTVNDKPGSDVHFAPGWTSYQQTIQYQSYDITDLLQEENEIRFTVGNGWYKGVLGFFNQGDHYGKRTALIAQIEITYADGTTETVCTDESWRSTTGPHRYNDIYHGAVIDFTKTENETAPVRLHEQSKAVLVAQQNDPVRVVERLSALKKIITPQGDVVIDFGQNLTGVVEAKLCYPRGTAVTVRYAEALDENGNFYTTNLRTAKCTDTFICSGGEDVFFPSFTFHGFRYIAVEGLGADFDMDTFTACVIHTDLVKTGDFTCSHELVNRLMKNIDWSLRDNSLDIPTDCPQRDERMGYTGDCLAFSGAAVCMRDMMLFWSKWLNDVKYEQSLGQGVPSTVPNIMGPGGAIGGFHDAAAVIPWVLYEAYGDEKILRDQFRSMVDCVTYYRDNMTNDKGLIAAGQQLGDWVSLDVPKGPYRERKEPVWNLELIEKIGATEPYYVANVFYLHSVRCVVKAAKVLGLTEQEEEYTALYEKLLATIRDEYITKNGRVISQTQTGCAMALEYGVAEEQHRETILNDLKNNLQGVKNHLRTGFAGTPVLCPALSHGGAHDIAGSVFLKEECPGWLYSVKLGATTVWELWDGVNEDGSFNKFEMNSLNHYSYGSVAAWVYHDLLGLQLVEPGYKKSRIAPRMILGIPEMQGYIDTVYGRLSCAISCLDYKYTIDITVPANTTAIVALPEQEERELGSGSYHFEYATQSTFVIERYNMDTPFGDLLANPIGKAILSQYAKELMENELFMMFARSRPIIEVMGMLPPEIKPLMDMVMQQCNANPVE